MEEHAMSLVTTNQPDGTPAWIELAVPDLARAMEFYRALFGWEYEVGPAEHQHATMCLLDGRTAAGLVVPGPGADTGDAAWTVYLATEDCDGAAERVTAAGGTVVQAPVDIGAQGRMAIVRDPVGAWFGLWQGRGFVGAEVVNEPGALVRNDLVTPTPEPARAFYAAVFGYTLDRNEDLPDFDFTFLRRPDGKEVAGIMGLETVPSSSWSTTFEVADTDAVVEAASAAGGTAGAPDDMLYGRFATITDPFGAEFSVIARPADQPG
jgi:uncharacterized protein